MSNDSEYVLICGVEYDNVTVLWKPRLNPLASILAFLIPGLYLVVSSALLFTLGQNRFGWHHMVKVYQEKKKCIYFVDYFGEELFALITKPVDVNIKLEIDMYRHECQMRERQIKSAALHKQPCRPTFPPSLCTATVPGGIQTFPFRARTTQPFAKPFPQASIPHRGVQPVGFGNYGMAGNAAFHRAPLLPPIRPLLLPSPLKTMTLPPEVYELFDKPSLFKFHVYWRTDGVYVTAPGLQTPIKFCDKLDGVVTKPKGLPSVWVSGEQLTAAHKCSPFSCNFPKVVRLAWSVLKLIALPIGKILMDLADVMVDMYYFVRLDSGDLVHSTITRQVFVSYGILTFGMLGAIKSTVFAYMVLEVIKSSTDQTANIRSDFLKVTAACLKILSEDGPELVLEYFFVDKYVTENQPWWIVLKDTITTLLYLIPIVRVIKSGRHSYKLLRTSSSLFLEIFGTHVNMFRWSVVFVCGTLIHFLFSLTMIFRVLGMIYQYSSDRISKHCLLVNFRGELIQTPFHLKCLNGFDYVILILIATVGTLFLFIFSYILFVKLGILLKYFQTQHKNIVRYSVNGETLSMKESERYNQDRQTTTLIKFDCKKRYFSEETESNTPDTVNRWKVENHFSETVST